MIDGKLRKDIGKILRMLCDYKHVEIIEGHAMPDHIHMLASIPPKLAVADFMGYLKGKSTMMIHRRSRLTVEGRSKKATPSAVGVAHYAPLGAAGIMALIGPFCKPHVQRGVMIEEENAV